MKCEIELRRLDYLNETIDSVIGEGYNPSAALVDFVRRAHDRNLYINSEEWLAINKVCEGLDGGKSYEDTMINQKLRVTGVYRK